VSTPKALVVAGPGTNRDADIAAALALAGAAPQVVLSAQLAADPGQLDSAQMLVVAGGFSYGDALGAGRMLALELSLGRLGDALREFVAAGNPVLGICNGFQVLTRAGLLPGALGHNAGGSFQCRWVTLQPSSMRSVWTRNMVEPIHCPIAHGEGRYVTDDLTNLQTNDQVALRYVDGTNPNGSIDDIAGVCDPTGVVLGLMPHPENAVLPRQMPSATARTGAQPSAAPSASPSAALQLLTNGVNYAKDR
jgi:phosphoribosylformylglycinamidine synthase subunit PurQ / glutaminase